jgi:hypothetical protein
VESSGDSNEKFNGRVPGEDSCRRTFPYAAKEKIVCALVISKGSIGDSRVLGQM